MQSCHSPVVYLASPLGFSESQRKLVLPHFISALEAAGASVYEPFSTNEQNGLGPDSNNDDWALDIAFADRDGVSQCDALFAVINGVPPDEGVAVEVGIAAALQKPTFLFRDDFRKASDSGSFSVNLMLYCGLPKRGWQGHVFGCIDEITDPQKGFVKWVAQWRAGASAST